MANERDSFFKRDKKPNQNTNKLNKEQKNRHDNFDKNRAIKKDDTNNPDKKPFDKKAYRLKKYSKKYKLGQWEEQRKKKLIREYQKDVKNDPAVGSYKSKGFDEDTTDSQSIGQYVRHPDIIKLQLVKAKKDPFQKAKDHFTKVKEDKAKKREELEKIKAERDLKLQEYKKNKYERFKKLSQKTKKGQPVMTGRLELLLDKIQKGK